MLPLLPRLLAGAAARARRSALFPAFAVAARPSTSGTVAPSPRRLADILHLEKLGAASGPEIAAIWADFHDAAAAAAKKTRDGGASPPSSTPTPHAFRLGTSMAAAAYTTFKARASASPLLALPIAKQGSDDGGRGAGGSLTLLVQAQLPHLLISTLGEYRESGPAAPAHAIVTHYDDLAADKGVVLVRTDLVSPHVLSPEEAAAVVATIHRLYLDDDGPGHAFVHAFNHTPASFDWGALCKHLGVEAGSGE